MRYLLSLVTLAAVAASQASNLPMTFWSNAHQQSNLFNGFTRDRSTGTFYKFGHYVGASLNSYSNVADFQADTNSNAVGLGDSRFGTYGVVRNGKLFMRSGSDPNGTVVARFDAASGAVEAYGNFPGYDGTNGQGTFDWGGYSGFNMFDDPSGLFMFARDIGGNQRVAKLDNNFNILNSYIVGDFPNDASFGYAFNVKGQLFISNDFFNLNFTRRVDLSTGNTTTVNFTFTGVPQFPYLSHVWYDDLADRLYLTSAGSGSGIAQATYVLDNASGALGVVPEPASILAVGAGIVSLVARRRRRRA